MKKFLNSYTNLIFLVACSIGVGCIFISVLLYVILGNCNCNSTCELINSILISIGAGLISSAFLSYFLERISAKKERERYNIIVSNLRRCIFGFNITVVHCCSEKFNGENKKRNFDQWISLAFDKFNDETEDEHAEFLENMIYGIQKIADSCRTLYSNASLLMNDHITEEWVRNVRSLEAVCNIIVRDFKKCKYEICQKRIINPFKNKIGNLFKDIEEFLNSDYNEDSEDIDGWSVR